MRRYLPLIVLLSLWMNSCDGWVYVVPTFPAPPPSPTPAILSPTPLFLTLSPPPSQTPAIATAAASSTATATTAFTQPAEDTATPSPTLPVEPTKDSVLVEVLGCKTSFDVSHGMGEVTDAYITLSNTGESDVSDLCATLFALDEGRPHPDKTVCVPILPAGHVVTLKLTVDTTAQQATPIQVEVKHGETLINRVGQPSCTDIDLAPPPASTLKTPFPVQP